MSFKFTKTPDVVFVCDKCGERVTYHGAILRVYERDGAWEHDECVEALRGRERGKLHPVKP